MGGFDCVDNGSNLREGASGEEEERGVTGGDVNGCLGAEATGARAGDEDCWELEDRDNGIEAWERATCLALHAVFECRDHF